MGVRARPLVLLAAVGVITPAAAEETIHIRIDKLKFDPPEVSARVGDTVEWTNSDFVAHTATARNKDWDATISTKGSAHITLEHSGDVDYFCRFHPNMTGRISVTR